MAIKNYKVEKIDNGDYLITMDETFVFGLFKRTKQYRSVGKYVAGFYKWVNHPENTLPGINQYQLDRWVEIYERSQ